MVMLSNHSAELQVGIFAGWGSCTRASQPSNNLSSKTACRGAPLTGTDNGRDIFCTVIIGTRDFERLGRCTFANSAALSSANNDTHRDNLGAILFLVIRADETLHPGRNALIHLAAGDLALPFPELSSRKLSTQS
jgi:hypothetical protein